MQNLDAKNDALYGRFVESLKSDDEAQVKLALAEMCSGLAQSVLDDAKELAGERDAAILAQRGVRQLTTPERNYYQAVIEAMKSDNPRQALTNINATLPETVMDTVMDDVTSQFPLLGAINVVNTTAITKWILNKQAVQLAGWGVLGSGITTELSGNFEVIDMTACKLSAYFPVPKDFLILGPEWLDRYVRAVLAEAIAGALEKAVVTGTGKDQPIGMDRSVADNVSITAGVYPQKSKVTLASLGSKDYLTVVEKLTKTKTGRYRAVNEVALICNPSDYFKIIRPATTVQSTTGTYVGDVFPFPTRVYQSSAVASGEAIMGLLDRYFLGLGTSKEGLIGYDDSVKYLDDARVYMTKVLGNGRPMDDNAFVRLDISGLEEGAVPVKVKGTVKTTVDGTVTTKASAT